MQALFVLAVFALGSFEAGARSPASVAPPNRGLINASLAGELSRKSGFSVQTVYRSVVGRDRDASAALAKFGAQTGLAPVEATVARQLDQLRRACAAQKGGAGPCLEGSERVTKELELLRSLAKGKDLKPVDRVYLGALIFHHQSVVSFFDPEFERAKLRCRKATVRRKAECEARKRDLLELGSATAQLADLAAYERERGPEARETGELRRVLKARFGGAR